MTASAFRLVTSPRRLRPREVALAILVAATLILGAALVARYAALGPSHTAAILFLGLAAVGIAVVCVVRWSLGLYLFLLWLVLEDLPRKFLGNDLLVYFGKDLLLAAVFVGFLLAVRAGKVARFRPAFLLPLLAFVGVGILQIFNPSSPSVLYGLLGIKLYYYYIPLAFLGYALIGTKADLHRFLAFNLGLAGVVAALGITQAIVGLDFLNPAKTPEHLHLLRLIRQSPLTGHLVPRPTSIFVSDGRFAWYMLFALFLAVGAASYWTMSSMRSRRWGLTAVGAVAAAIVLSGSRGTFVYAAASVLVFASAVVWGNRRPGSRAPVLARIGAAVGAAIVMIVWLFPESVGARWAFYYETIAPWSPASELAYRAGEYPIGGFLAAFSFPNWPLGYGIGTSSLGVQYLTKVFALPTTGAAVESGYGTLVVEMGIPGLVTWLAWTIALLWSGWAVVRDLRGSPLFPVGFGLFWFAFVLLFPMTYGGMQPYQNFVFNAFLWLCVGVLFKLPTLREDPDRSPPRAVAPHVTP